MFHYRIIGYFDYDYEYHDLNYCFFDLLNLSKLLFYPSRIVVLECIFEVFLKEVKIYLVEKYVVSYEVGRKMYD